MGLSVKSNQRFSSTFVSRTVVIGVMLLTVAHAQSTGPLQSAAPAAAVADPQNPTASVPSIVYRSAFEGYRAFATEKVQPWRETNDTVGRIGGWRVYAREAQQALQPEAEKPNAPAVQQPAGAPAAKPAPHKH